MNDRTVRRAARLVRLYPRQWREQFPDFPEMLADELAEHPRAVRRNVVHAAMTERLRAFGLIPRRPAEGARSGLALIYAALIPFIGLAMGMWSQLHTGLASDRAATPPDLHASNLLLTVGTLMVLMALPLALFLVMVDVRRNRREWGPGLLTRYRPMVGPALVLVGSLAVLTCAGWAAAGSGWYSPAAAALPHQGPGHLATLWIHGIIATITPAWIHPTLFTRMPLGELVSALVAPVAAFTASAAMFRLIVRCPVRWPSRASAAVATGVFAMMFACVIACGRWLFAHPGREGASAFQMRGDQLAPGHTGWLACFLLAALAITTLVGLRRVLGSKPEDQTPSDWGDVAHPGLDGAVPGRTAPLLFNA